MGTNTSIFIFQKIKSILVDGMRHHTNPEQIIADFNRDYFSFKNGFFTKRITNESIESNLEEIADAIAFVSNNVPSQMGEALFSKN